MDFQILFIYSDKTRKRLPTLADDIKRVERERERERERVRVQGEKQRVFLDSGPRVEGKSNYTKEMFLK